MALTENEKLAILIPFISVIVIIAFVVSYYFLYVDAAAPYVKLKADADYLLQLSKPNT